MANEDKMYRVPVTLYVMAGSKREAKDELQGELQFLIRCENNITGFGPVAMNKMVLIPNKKG